jgi:hypothetical protein
MGDEEQQLGQRAEEQGSVGPGGAEPGPGSEEPGAQAEAGPEAAPPTGEGAQPDADAGAEEGREGFSVRTVNGALVGRLTLHYPSRDVTLGVDGEAAIRILTMFWRRQPGSHADQLDPETSSALSAWIVMDLGEPLAVSWCPVLGSLPTRTAIDPVPPQAA